MPEDKKQEMKVLSKADILSASDVLTKEVPVPEWGGVVLLKTMTGAMRDQYETKCIMNRQNIGGVQRLQMKQLKVYLLARCVVDEEGKPIFTDADLAALNEKNAKVINRLFDEACEMNGIGEKDIEDLAKNSVSESREDSGSDSQEEKAKQ